MIILAKIMGTLITLGFFSVVCWVIKVAINLPWAEKITFALIAVIAMAATVVSFYLTFLK